MEVLSSRILLRPPEPDRARRFYRDVLGLAIYREFGDPGDPGPVFLLGHGFLEVAARPDQVPAPAVAIWLQGPRRGNRAPAADGGRRARAA
jgi:catechol 2,3-dioxygenase-like lactoylglutathione lyase family enzyme